MDIKNHCVMTVILDSKLQCVLLIRNFCGPFANQLNAVGGKVQDTDLSIYSAIAREITEEVPGLLNHEFFSKELVTMNFSNGFVLEVFYTVLNKDIDCDSLSYSSDEGVLEWIELYDLHNTYLLLNIDTEDIADGIEYFITLAIQDYQKNKYGSGCDESKETITS